MYRFGLAATEQRQSIVCLTREASGFGTGFLQADHSWVSRFLCGHIFPGALAQNLRGLRYVENVIDDLERETQSLSKPCDSRKFSGVCVGAHRTESHRAVQDGCGLILMDKLQLIAFDVLAFGFEIGHLTGDEFLTARRNCNLAQQG